LGAGEGGGGRTRLMADGAVFEKAGVAFSHVHGTRLPPSATALRPELAGQAWEALGVSLVLHPRNPYVPTAHANIRFFVAGADSAKPIWWFGGGFDLTPYYGFEDDAIHWHRTARAAVTPFGNTLYPRFKNSATIISGSSIATNRGESAACSTTTSPSSASSRAWHSLAVSAKISCRPIVLSSRAARLFPTGTVNGSFNSTGAVATLSSTSSGTAARSSACQSGGRTESILMSLPPLVRWEYNWKPDPGSAEAKLSEVFLQPRDWANESG